MIRSRTSSVTESIKMSAHSLQGLGIAPVVIAAAPTIISTAGSLVSKLIGGRQLSDEDGLRNALAVAQAAIEGRSVNEIQQIYEATKHTKYSYWDSWYGWKNNEQIARAAIDMVNEFLARNSQPTITYEQYAAQYRKDQQQYQAPQHQTTAASTATGQQLQIQEASIPSGNMPSWLLPAIGGIGVLASLARKR